MSYNRFSNSKKQGENIVRIFREETDIEEYQNWREQNPYGYVLNINTINPDSTRVKNLLHIAAGCQSLNVPPAANQDRPVTPEHPKYCSTVIHEILNEMRSEGLIRTVHACNHCRVKYSNLFNDSGFDGWLNETMQPRAFELGYLYVTPAAREAVDETEINQLLDRYSRGIWGTASAEERHRNEQGLSNNENLISTYQTSNGTKLLIITVWDRSRTVVLVKSNDDENPINPQIKSFLDEQELETAISHISVQEVNRPDTITMEEEEFLEAVVHNGLSDTEREQTIRSRVGQSLFRAKLLHRRKRCELCGLAKESLLTASHIKDWSKCENDFERLDPDNGLLLCPNHDRVFDNKLISFDDAGKILISSDLNEEDLLFLNLDADRKIELLGMRRVYMAWHRESYGFQ